MTYYLTISRLHKGLIQETTNYKDDIIRSIQRKQNSKRRNRENDNDHVANSNPIALSLSYQDKVGFTFLSILP